MYYYLDMHNGLFTFADPDFDSGLDSDPIPIVGKWGLQSETDSMQSEKALNGTM